MSRLLPVLFWACASGAGWVLVGYPFALALRRPRGWRQAEALPSLTIVVCAYRERAALEAKLRALGELDYPTELLQVVVAVDEDRELARIATRAWPGAQVLFSARRQGKPAALNRALAVVTSEAVVLTDANNILRPQSLRAAVRHLADPTVWAVAGRRGEAGSAYDGYEDLLRRLETRSGSVAALSGELIVVRRERVPPFPSGVVNDDLWLLCRLAAGGGRIVYDPAAGSSEEALEPRQELSRRARMGAGRVLLAPELRRVPPGFALRLASHKVGRLALPPLLLGAFVSAVLLVHRPLYRAAALTQVALYAPGLIALTGASFPGRSSLLFRASRELVVGCAGSAIGLVRGLRRRQPVRWEAVR